MTQSEWRPVSAQRQAADGADMLLELRDGAGGFRPVAGIVDARRDLVGQQRAVGKHEELDADDADIVERLEDRERVAAAAAAAVSADMRAGRVEVCRMPSRWTFSAGS